MMMTVIQKNPSDCSFTTFSWKMLEDVGRSMMNQPEITNNERHESGVLGLPHATNLSDRATFHTRSLIWGRGTCEDRAIWLAGAEGHKAILGRLGSSEKH